MNNIKLAISQQDFSHSIWYDTTQMCTILTQGQATASDLPWLAGTQSRYIKGTLIDVTHIFERLRAVTRGMTTYDLPMHVPSSGLHVVLAALIGAMRLHLLVLPSEQRSLC